MGSFCQQRDKAYIYTGSNNLWLFALYRTSICTINLKRKQLEKLTSVQSTIVLGGLLGDMHIQKNHESRDGNCRLRFSHSVEQREYILWKHKALLDAFCKNTQGVHLERRKDQRYSSYILYTERRAE